MSSRFRTIRPPRRARRPRRSGRQHGHPDRARRCSGSAPGAEHVAAQLVPPRVARPPAGEADRPLTSAPAPASRSKHSRSTCATRAHRGEHPAGSSMSSGRRARVVRRGTRARPGSTNGTARRARHRVAQRDVADLARALGERVEVLPGNSVVITPAPVRTRLRAATGRRAARGGSPAPVYRQQRVGPPLRARVVPSTSSIAPPPRARGELGGAAVVHAAMDAHTLRHPAARRLRADARHAAASCTAVQHGRVDVQRVDTSVGQPGVRS